MKKAFVPILILLMIIGISFLLGYNFGGSRDCIVSEDDPACQIYWEDGSMTTWFGRDFVLEPGESVEVPIHIPEKPEKPFPSIIEYIDYLTENHQYIPASILCQYMAACTIGVEEELAEMASEYIRVQIENRSTI